MSRIKVERVTCDSCGYIFEDDEYPNEFNIHNTLHDDIDNGETVDLCTFCSDVLLRIMLDAKEKYGHDGGIEDGLRSCTHVEV